MSGEICCRNCIPTENTGPTPPPPTSNPPVPSNLRPVPEASPVCYLPQPEDAIPIPPQSMGPIGPWATGRVDWSPLAGVTGTRPVVDKYSIARYSEGEWRRHNRDILNMSKKEQHRMNLVNWNGRQCLQQTQADVDKTQEDNTKRLRQREQEVHRWKCELEAEIEAISEECTLMEEQRRRLKQASKVLQMPESIAGECIERRTGRLDTEIIRDEVEVELISELALTAEIRQTFNRTLKDIESQLLENQTSKQRLEYDWSDKLIADQIEALNISLNNTSNTMLFKPGAVIFPENQSTPEYWTHFTEETLHEAKESRQRSERLRQTLDAVLANAARDLITQANKVDAALSKRIACVEQITNNLEQELRKILQDLVDVETLMIDLQNAIRRMDIPMKKAHTRLENRLGRPRVENCRDAPHHGLIEEVKVVKENVAALQAQLKQAEQSQTMLITARNDLEREIMLKYKTLEIEKQRIQWLRSHYPSATALSGY